MSAAARRVGNQAQQSHGQRHDCEYHQCETEVARPVAGETGEQGTAAGSRQDQASMPTLAQANWPPDDVLSSGQSRVLMVPVSRGRIADR